jgi:hypothetical protein
LITRKLSEIPSGKINEGSILDAFVRAHDCQPGHSHTTTGVVSCLRQLMGTDRVYDRRPVAIHTFYHDRAIFLGAFGHARLAEVVKADPVKMLTVTQIMHGLRHYQDDLLEGRWIAVKPTRWFHVQPIAAVFATASTLYAMPEAERTSLLTLPYTRITP